MRTMVVYYVYEKLTKIFDTRNRRQTKRNVKRVISFFYCSKYMIVLNTRLLYNEKQRIASNGSKK